MYQIEYKPQIAVHSKLHPFKGKIIRDTVPYGASISQILDYLAKKNNVTGWYTRNVYVELNGKPILAADFDFITVEEKDNLVVQFCVPQGGGGGKNILRALLMVVVAVVAIATYQYELFGIYSAYGAAAIAVFGNLAINMLVPLTPLSETGLGHKDSTESDVYSISGMRNYAPNYKALPMVLGRVRYAPPYGAIPYTSTIGNDQFLHCDFVWCAGETTIEEIKIEETLISSYSEVTIKTNNGKITDKPLTLYPYDINEEGLSVSLKYNSPAIKTTVEDTDKFNFDLVFPRGLFKLDDEGNRQYTSVTIGYFYRKAGEAYWAGPIYQTYTDKTAMLKRINFEVDVSGNPGQYETQIIRYTADKEDSNDKLYDDVVWTVLRSVKYQDPVTFDCPISETQLVIKATDQLNGVIDSLNGIVTSVCLDYDINSGKWIKRATNNPASLYRYVYQGPGLAKPLSDAFLDIPALEEWHEFCRINKFTYNKVHDGQMSCQAVINDICHAGRATFVRLDDMCSVVIDKDRQYGPVQMFTPENSRGFSLKKIFLDELHGYRVLFNNEDSSFQEDEVTIYNKDYTYRNATLIESLEFAGITNVDHVKAMTKYHMATREHRSELFTFDVVDWEHIVCSRGDLIRFSNPSILVSLGSGRIKSTDHSLKQIVLDQEFSFEDGVEYGISVRTNPTDTAYSEVFTLPIVPDDSTTDLLNVEVSFPDSIVKGILYSIGKLGYEALDLLVTSKTPKKDFSGTITAVQYVWPEIDAYLNGNYPEIHTGVTSLVYTPRDTPPPPTIIFVNTGISSAEQLPDGTTLNRIIIMVSIPSGWKVPVESVQAEILIDNVWIRSTNTDPSKSIVFDNIIPGDYEIRVRSISASGLTSAWVYRTVSQVTGTPTPDPVIAMTVTGKLFVNDIEWVLPADYRLNYFVEIYCTVGINDRESSHRIAKLSGGNIWTHTGLVPGAKYYYWIRIVDDEAHYSEWYPLSATGGIEAIPTTDPANILEMLTASITDSQLSQDLNTRIDNTSIGFVSQQTLLENEWTVKIQEIDGHPYMIGLGAVLYPDWKDGVTYTVGQYVWMESVDNVYRCVVEHNSTVDNGPPLENWELVPYGKKSAVAIIADQFSVSMPDGTGTKTPFVINGDAIGIDGTLTVNGSIGALAMSTTDLFAMKIQSQNYVPGESGFFIDPTGTGRIEFNADSIELNTTITSDIGGLTVRNTITGDETRVSSGDVNTYYNENGTLTLYQSLNRFESGTGYHGLIVTIPGLWKSPPKVRVFPGSGLQTYNPAIGTSQPQALYLSAKSLSQYAPRRYRFSIEALLRTLGTSAISGNLTGSAVYTNKTPSAGIFNTAGFSIPTDVIQVSLTGTINWTLTPVNTAPRKYYAVINLFWNCAGVQTLVQQFTTPIYIQSTPVSGVISVSQTINAGGSGNRVGYYTATCIGYTNTRANPNAYATMYEVFDYVFSEIMSVSISSSLQIGYTLPAGAVVAAGNVIWDAVGE